MNKNGTVVVLGFLIAFFALLFVVRFNVTLLLFSIAALLLIAAISYIFMQHYEEKQQRRYQGTYAGNIELKIRQARTQLSKHERQIEDIERNIGELKSKLETSPDLNGPMVTETNRLIKAFRSELKLRHTKIGFYQTCIKKLKALLQNHQMLMELENKQNNLKKLQEGNYDDLADIENMKSDMEYEKLYLESIEQLSNRMLESDTLDLAQDLNLELEEITRELGDL